MPSLISGAMAVLIRSRPTLNSRRLSDHPQAASLAMRHNELHLSKGFKVRREKPVRFCLWRFATCISLGKSLVTVP